MTVLCQITTNVLEAFRRTLCFLKAVGAVDSYVLTYSNVVYSMDLDKYLDSYIGILEELKVLLDKLYFEKTKRALDNEASLFIEAASNSNSMTNNDACISACITGGRTETSYASSQLQMGAQDRSETTRDILDLNVNDLLRESGVSEDHQESCMLSHTTYNLIDSSNKPLAELIDSIGEPVTSCHYKTGSGSATLDSNRVPNELTCLTSAESAESQLSKELDQLLQPCNFGDKCTEVNATGFEFFQDKSLYSTTQETTKELFSSTQQAKDLFSTSTESTLQYSQPALDCMAESLSSQASSWPSTSHSSHRLATIANPPKKKFTCVVCSKEVTSRRNLVQHLQSHSGVKSYSCDHCGKQFSTKPNLKTHLIRQHNLATESAFPCPECGKLFSRKSALEAHLKVHQGLKPFSCYICGKCFAQKISRDVHIASHTGNYKFTCKECPKRFPTQSKLNFHMKSHGEPQYSCNICSKRFANKQYLKKHSEVHNVPLTQAAQCLLESALDGSSSQSSMLEDFRCTQCELSFQTKASLLQHKKKTHRNKVPKFHCTIPDCTGSVKIFFTKQMYDRHNERYHSVVRRMFQCTTCGAEFADKSTLSHHEDMKHAGVPPPMHTCPMCSKAFTLKAKLRAHIRTHTTEPHLACNICGKKYYRGDNLKKHMLSHTNSGARCTICDKTMANSASLENHMKIHNGPVFTCSQCSKTFTTKTALDYHMDKHNNKFSFTCETCGKQFVRKCHYEGHLKTHSSERPYVCSTCGRGFRNLGHFKVHMKRVHGHNNMYALPELASNSNRIPQTATTTLDDLQDIMDSSSEISNFSGLLSDTAQHHSTFNFVSMQDGVPNSQ